MRPETSSARAPIFGAAADLPLLAAVVALMALGLVMVYSASVHVATTNYGDGTYYLEKQLLSAGLGVAALLGGMMTPYRQLRRYAYPILGVALLLLVLVLVPGIGTTANKSTRWLRLPGFSFQPSELGKLAFVIWLAYSMEKKALRIKSFTLGLLPHLLLAGIFVALFLAQPDLGVSIVLSLVMVLMLFAGGTRFGYLVALALTAAPVLVYAIAGNHMRMQRVLAFLDPWEHRYDSAYALVNSMAAMGSGGLWGQGLGGGMQKFGYIPEAQTDFIFPVIGEELGFVGSAAVILLFAFIVYRGVRIALRARDDFGRYLAFGLTMLVGVQATINIGVSMALLPTKGLTLPFVSYGGTSLVVSALLIGILVNISADGAAAPAEARGEAPHSEWRAAEGAA